MTLEETLRKAGPSADLYQANWDWLNETFDLDGSGDDDAKLSESQNKALEAAYLSDDNIAHIDQAIRKAGYVHRDECKPDGLSVSSSQAPASREMALPREMTPDLMEILGRPNFACREIAQVLKADGADIPPKAEAEQAHAIYFLLSHYVASPGNWQETATDELCDTTARLASIDSEREPND